MSESFYKIFINAQLAPKPETRPLPIHVPVDALSDSLTPQQIGVELAERVASSGWLENTFIAALRRQETRKTYREIIRVARIDKDGQNQNVSFTALDMVGWQIELNFAGSFFATLEQLSGESAAQTA